MLYLGAKELLILLEKDLNEDGEDSCLWTRKSVMAEQKSK